MIRYTHDDTTLYVFFSMKEYVTKQPKSSNECSEMITYFKTIIDAIRSKFPIHRQQFLANLEDSYISDMYSLRYTVRMLNEIHQYTKDDKQLDCIILKNTGNIIERVYKFIKPFLPPFIDELLVIEKEDNQQDDTGEEIDDAYIAQELAKCIRGS
jgi:hypothetical protein